MEFSTENSFSPSASKVLGRCQYFWRARAWLSLILQSARRPVSREKVLYACKASVRRACGSSAVVLCWNCSSLHVKIGTCDVSRCGHRQQTGLESRAGTVVELEAGAPTSQSQFFSFAVVALPNNLHYSQAPALLYKHECVELNCRQG